MTVSLILLLKIARKFYGSLFGGQDLFQTLPCAELNEEVASKKIYETLNLDHPCMIARFGSNELGCLVNYLGIKHGAYPIRDYLLGKCPEWWWNKGMMKCMETNAGFSL